MKDEVKSIWKQYDVLIVLGSLYITTLVVTGMVAGQTARRETMKIINGRPNQIFFELTPEFLQKVQNIPNPVLQYTQLPK